MLDRQLCFFVYSTLPKATFYHFFEAGVTELLLKSLPMVSATATDFDESEVMHEL